MHLQLKPTRNSFVPQAYWDSRTPTEAIVWINLRQNCREESQAAEHLSLSVTSHFTGLASVLACLDLTGLLRTAIQGHFPKAEYWVFRTVRCSPSEHRTSYSFFLEHTSSRRVTLVWEFILVWGLKCSVVS